MCWYDHCLLDHIQSLMMNNEPQICEDFSLSAVVDMMSSCVLIFLSIEHCETGPEPIYKQME
jgi:hypothetical protein